MRIIKNKINCGVLAATVALSATVASFGVSAATASASVVVRPLTTCEVLANTLSRDQSRLDMYQKRLNRLTPGIPAYDVIAGFITSYQSAVAQDRSDLATNSCTE